MLGAESTGKTQLAHNLTQALRARGHQVHLVSEYLRSWCDQHSRTPRVDEQAAIAETQSTHIAQAAANTTPNTSYLIADTTALMTAVYSELLFADTSLYPSALAQQRNFDATLITGLDLPWVADGLQRDGPQAREPVDACLRSQLSQANLRYQVVYGRGPARLQNALHAIDSIAGSAGRTSASGRFSLKETKPWKWNCEKCSDPECEHRLFSNLLHR